MANYQRKRSKKASYIWMQALQGLARFMLRTRKRFQRLKPGARIAFVGLSSGVLVLAVVLIVQGGKKEASVAGVTMQTPTTMADTLSAADALTLSFETASPVPEASITPAVPPTPTPEPSLHQGVEDSERVTKLQDRLMELGYLDIDETTQHFGPATEDAVRFFQRQYELPQDGIANAELQAIIFSSDAKKYAMLEGMTGTDIENFQRQLKELGYYKGSTDGQYGENTVAAVTAFQKQNKLSQDGKAGLRTVEMINSDDANASPDVVKEQRRKVNVDTMIATAKKQLGKKYILGNVGPNSFDCSGLVYYCLKEGGSNRRRLNAAGYSGVSDWEKITSYSNLQKGDLLFFYNDGKTKIGHVGIYIGGGEMVDASSRNGKVVRRSATSSYWKSHFVCARRPW